MDVKAMETGEAAFFTNIDKVDTNAQDNIPYIFSHRKGAVQDKLNFESLFWTKLGLNPLTEKKEDSSVENLTKESWTKWKKRLKEKDFSKSKYVLLAFSSHGDEVIVNGRTEPGVILSDGNRLSLSEITKVLDIDSLKGKPKIVMMLTCRIFIKEPEPFDLPFHPTKSPAYLKGDLKITKLSASQVQFQLNITTPDDLDKHEIVIISKKNPDWEPANPTIETNIYKITNLDFDTTYYITLRKKEAKNIALDPQIFRTLEQEDVGVDILVNIEPSPPIGDGQDEGDDPSRFNVTPVAEEELFSAGEFPNDFLIVYGTTRGRPAKRNDVNGSWVLQELQKVLEEDQTEELDFFHLLTKAAQGMATRATKNTANPDFDNKKSILCFSHTLTERVKFKKPPPVPLPVPNLSKAGYN